MSNFWLYSQLKEHSHLKVDSNYHAFIEVSYKNKIYKIYSPSSDEYLITVEIVQRVENLGVNIISYPTSWCRASSEAILYGKSHGINVIQHAGLFNILDAKG